MRKAVNWKIFFILLLSCLIGIVAIFPYVFTLQKNVLESIPVPFPLFILIQIIQSAIVFSVAIFVGLLLAKKVGFSLPLLEAILSKKNALSILRSIAPLAILLGILTGAAIIILDYVFIAFGVAFGITSVDVPFWQRLLVPLYGGINEEVLLRLFVMTLFVWISQKIVQTKHRTPTKAGIWISIILTAVLFGLGHLPITATLTSITPVVVLRAVLLNGVGGIVFGWLYWKKGLEAAIIAHFVTDIVLHIVFPVFMAS